MQRLLDPFRLRPRRGAVSLRLTRDVFVRALAVVYLVAIASLWVQVHGLVGSHGIWPAPQIAHAAHARGAFGTLFGAYPSLYWLWPTDRMLDLLCAGGVACAIGVLVGVLQGPLLLGLWAIYLSLVNAVPLFLAFQWDTLLVEVTFAALFVAPWRLRAKGAPEPVPLGMTALRLLYLKFIFLAGFAKLASGDSSWRDLTALAYHWTTQPLPNPVSWYAAQLPLWFDKVAVVIMFIIEDVLPFGIFFGRQGRLATFCGTTLLMVLLELTGNFGFFQLLTVALALVVLDDSIYHELSRVPIRLPREVVPEAVGSSWRGYVVGTVLVWLFVMNALVVQRTFDASRRRPVPIPHWQRGVLMRVEPFLTVNSYGLFANMTKRRPEVFLEGSDDGHTWKRYELRYQPEVGHAPKIVAPHMPRLDWRLWFAALGPCTRWFPLLEDRLLQGSKPVLALFASNPFPDHPPKYIRSVESYYTFAPPGSGRWWNASPPQPYCPERTLEDGQGENLPATSDETTP